MKKTVTVAFMTKEYRTLRGAQKPAVVVRTVQARPSEPSFWDIDLVALFKLWLSDLSVFMRTAVMFIALSMPVVVSALLMWVIQLIRGGDN